MSKLNRDGYLLIDNRCAGQGVREMRTYTCNHCNRIVVMHPERTRDRGYCRACDSYICDACVTTRAQTGACRTMAQTIDDALTQAERLILRN